MRLLQGLRTLARYRSAVVGLAIIIGLIGLSIYTVIRIPYSKAIGLWRGGEGVWRYNPRNALPSWVNLFPGVDLPETLILRGGEKAVEPLSTKTRKMSISFSFDYNYDVFPSELAIVYRAKYEAKQPYVSVHWFTPDGREIKFGRGAVKASQWYVVSLDKKLAGALGRDPEEGLFLGAEGGDRPLKGTYRVVIEAYLFEPEADLDVEVVVYGRVCGFAGTDYQRRDIGLALMWGTPIALSFGLLGALGTLVLSFVIAAFGTWFGGLVDAFIQRATEVRMVLPTLAILIMVGMFYSKSLWLILGVIIALNIFSGAIKTYRAMFLQVKTSPYIEAARSYGAGNLRIIFRYLIPRAIPWLIPGFVLAVPDFVFLEASLAVLGLGDPVLPTWGKLLNDAYEAGALYHGYYYWVAEPAFFLMITGLAFTMLGFALDKIFNPKLREI